MTDSSSLNALNIGGYNLDEDKGVEMDAMTNGSMLHHDSHQGVSFNTYIGTPHIVENNDTSSRNDKATQEMANDLMQCPKKWDKEAILLNEDDHANDIKKSTRRTNLNVRNEKAPHVGMVFTTYEELNNYFKQYALRVGFGVAVKQSSFTKGGACRRLVLACSKGGTTRTDTTNQSRRRMKTNCEVMIVAKRHRDGFLYLQEVKLEHNHRVSPSSAKSMRCHKRMGNSMAENIVEHPSRGTNMLTEKERENATEIGKWKLAEGDGEAIHQFFASMKSKEPNFFYSVDLDEHKCLRNVFWANGRSMAAYQYFGDVVTLDTTYVTDKYDLPLVSFLGMNHHGHLVLLGCGIISDETSETYVWLFKAWLRCMLDCPPNAIITDQCKSIQKAVAKVFPRTHHRLCLSQVLKKIPEKLRGLPELIAIKKAIKKIAYDSLRVEEFDENWQKMIKTYGLESNEWLKILYGDRPSWVPVFLKGTTFWAGMSVSQRGERVPTFFEGSIFPKTSIKKFFGKYEMILQSKFKKETQTEFETFHMAPVMISKFYMEEQVSKVYTLNMLKKFQDELEATMYIHVTSFKNDGSVYTYELKECSFTRDSKRSESKDYQVSLHSDEVVQCICGFFNFQGILCRHVLAVFKFRDTVEIPSHYILDRWKKDFKRLRDMDHSGNEALVSDLRERFDYISKRLGDVGFISKDRYHLSLKLIKELEGSLFDDISGGERQQIHLGFSEDNTNSNSNLLAVKQRGRPPKKGRVSNVEPLVRTNKEQDCHRSALIANEDNVSQAAPTDSNLDTYIGQGGINVVEDYDLDNLSFASYFDFNVNLQHHMSNEPGLQPNSLLQGQYDQQTMDGQNEFPWIYQDIIQEDQIEEVLSIRRTVEEG